MTTSSSAAQDEYNELFRDKDTDNRHPEDRNNNSDHSDNESDSHDHDPYETTNTDDELEIPHSMKQNYYMPSLRSEANTGPKGVIADAQAFEQAKKQAKRFTWKKNAAPTSYSVSITAGSDKDSSEDEPDDSFMKEWRQARLQELQNVGQKIRSRTNSPSRRIYGIFPLVDGEGYLDAVEKTATGTVVVVFIYSNNSNSANYDESQRYEAYMAEVAKRNDTVRFIKMHNETAEIEDEGVPAVLAYNGGDKFASLVPLAHALPPDSELSAVSLENALRRHCIL